MEAPQTQPVKKMDIFNHSVTPVSLSTTATEPNTAMKPHQDPEHKKQSKNPTKPYTDELPPPNHPIYSILGMTGQLTHEIKKSDQTSPPPTPSPLTNLFVKIHHFFASGTQTASIRFAAIQTTVTMGETEVTPSALLLASVKVAGEGLPWNSCKLAATLVLLHAVPKDASVMFEALKFQSQSLGGLPTMSIINVTPSADLAPRFALAKKAAINGKVGKCTVLAVSLVDVEMIERGENKNKPMGYSSFAHTFVLAIGREGWRVFQSWGEHGYRLDEYLERGGARLRDWKEAKAFLKAFLVLATAEVGSRFFVDLLEDECANHLCQGSWSQKINDAYEACFEVNILKICGKKGPQKPIVPIYRPWVRFFEVEDVKDLDIDKFAWD